MSSGAVPLDVVNRAIEAADREDVAALRELFAADHVEHRHSHEPRPLPGDESQSVLDRYEQAFEEGAPDWSDFRTTVEERYACGDRVATVWSAEAVHRASGKTVVIRGFVIDRMADGGVAESWSSTDRLGLYQQLGVSPSATELARQAGLH